MNGTRNIECQLSQHRCTIQGIQDLSMFEICTALLHPVKWRALIGSSPQPQINKRSVPFALEQDLLQDVIEFIIITAG